MNVLKMNSEDRYSLKKCREKAIEDLRKDGIKPIHSPKSLMRLNRYFRLSNTFPHPNIQVELDWQYESPFLETYPEAKTQLREWTTKNISVLNYDHVKKYITQIIFLSTYQTYLDLQNDNSPSLDFF